MPIDVVGLTEDLVRLPSPSRESNVRVSDAIHATLDRLGFRVERLEYDDAAGQRKVSLVACLGEGTGGLAFFSHSDTVPGETWTRDPYAPAQEGGRLVGLGACDMKGPLAATIAAAADVDAARLRHPILVVVTADEETGGAGAKQVVAESALVRETRLAMGVVAEPTTLVPVYAHKGGCRRHVTAHGAAAHTSTDRGVSANFLIAPFLGEMAELAARLKVNPAYRNEEFQPPTNGFNMVIDDGGVPLNVTAARTVCTLSFRPMPGDRSAELVAYIEARARAYDLDFDYVLHEPLYTPPDSDIVQLALRASGAAAPMTVPFGTDGFFLKSLCPLVVLGPGDIAQAHTDGEWIDLGQLRRAVDAYRALIEAVCL